MTGAVVLGIFAGVGLLAQTVHNAAGGGPTSGVPAAYAGNRDTATPTGTRPDTPRHRVDSPVAVMPFRYTKQVLSGDTAVLEFETSVEGKYVNGVDIIRCDDEGLIVEFRVMMRPLQGIQAVHEQMGRRLAAGG